MRLNISLTPALLAKLRKLAIQHLRLLDMHAEYLLYRAIQQARLKPNPNPEQTQEVVHAQTEG